MYVEFIVDDIIIIMQDLKDWVTSKKYEIQMTFSKLYNHVLVTEWQLSAETFVRKWNFFMIPVDYK